MKLKLNQKVLLISKDRQYLIDLTPKMYSTKDGQFNLKKLIGKSDGTLIKTHLGKEFNAITPTFKDLLLKSKRGPQVVLLKDAAFIAAYTGLESGSKVVDAGTGSGWLAAYLAKIVAPKGSVTTYEYRKEFYKIAKENFTNLGIKTVKQKLSDVTKGVKEKNINLITLDLPEPWTVPNIEKALKPGGYLVAYLPNISQVQELEKNLSNSVSLELVTEIIQRDWRVKGKIARPDSQAPGHTAFLCFVRKLSY